MSKLHVPARGPFCLFVFCFSVLLVVLALFFTGETQHAQKGNEDMTVGPIRSGPMTDEERKKQNAEAATEPTPPKEHNVVAAFYDVQNFPAARLLLNNKGLQPIEVRPTMYSLEGASFDPPPVTVPPDSHIFVSLSDWVDLGGESFRQGSLKLFHVGKDLVLGSQIYLEDEANSLSFEERLGELGRFDSRRLEAIWMIPRKQAEVKILLSNTSDSVISVTAVLSKKPHDTSAAQTFTFMPHQTRVLDLRNDFESGDQFADAEIVGLSLEHDGAKSSLKAHGQIKDAEKGYSNIITFGNPNTAKSNELHGVGLHFGTFGNKKLDTVVAVKNVGNDTANVTTTVPYTLTDGMTGTVSMRLTNLKPGEIRLLNTSKIDQVGRRESIKIAGIEIKHDITPGGVIASVQSVGDNGNQVYRVPMFDPFGQTSSTGGYPWRIDETSSTFAYIKNTSDEEQEYIAYLSYGDDAQYMIGLKSISPHETVQIDVKKLRDEQLPDERGNVIPSDVSHGQIKWTIRGEQFLPDQPLKRFNLVGRSEQIDTAKGVSSSYACQNCCSSNAWGWVLSNGGTEGEVGDYISFSAWEETRDCNGYYSGSYTVTYSSNVSWQTSNSSILEKVGAGLAQIVGVGNANFGAHWWRDVADYDPWCPILGKTEWDPIPKGKVDMLNPDCEVCFTVSKNLGTNVGILAKPKITIAEIGSVEKDGTKSVTVTISGSKNTPITFALQGPNNQVGAVKFHDGEYGKTITPNTNSQVTETLTIRGHFETALNGYHMIPYYNNGTELPGKKPVTVSTVLFQQAADCSGFDDTVPNQTFLSVPKSGSNTVKAKISPDGANGTFNFQAQNGITVSPTSITNAEVTLTVTGGNTTGTFTLEALANQSSLAASTLNAKVLSRLDKTLKFYAVTEAGNPATPPPSSNIPTATGLETYLNNTWGKQANVYFAVSRGPDFEANYDLDEDGRIDSASQAEVEAVINGESDSTKDFNLYFLGIRVKTRPDGQTPAAFSSHGLGVAIFGHVYNGTRDYITAHEIGHLLGAPPRSTGTSFLMFESDLSASPCKIGKSEWDIVNP